jgi:hypothetical protein
MAALGGALSCANAFFVVMGESVRDYPNDDVREGRLFPFSRVEVLMRVTPELVAPGSSAGSLLRDVPYESKGGSVKPRDAFLGAGQR